MERKTGHRTMLQVAYLVESNFGNSIRALFERYPELVGFTIYGAPRSSENAAAGGQERGRLDIELALSRMVGTDEYGEIFERISTEIDDCIAAQPEAVELLRGRTFARSLQ